MKALRIFVLIIILPLAIFCLWRAQRGSRNLGSTSPTLPAAMSEPKRSLASDEKKSPSTVESPPSLRQTVRGPAQVGVITNTATPARAIIGSAWKTEQQPELAAFAQWTERFLAATDAQREGLISEGIEFAEQRRLVLAQLIRSDPARALAAAVPLAVRTRLPADVENLLEERVSGSGDLALIGVTPAPGQQVAEPIFRSAFVNGRSYRAFTYGRREHLATLPNASIIGVAVNGKLAVSDSPLRVLEPGEKADGRPVENVCVISGKATPVTVDRPLNVTEPTAVEVNGQVHVLCEAAHVILYENQLVTKESANVDIAADGGPGSGGVSGRPTLAWTHGTKRVLIIRVDFSDLPGPSVSEEDAVNLFNNTNGVRDYYQQGSYGKTSLQIAPVVAGDSPDVTETFRMPRSAADYATNGIATFGDTLILDADARAAAQAAGYSMDAYDRIGVAFPDLLHIPGSKVNYSGFADVIGKRFAINGSFGFQVVAHELGHNYGIWHASRWQVSDGNPISETGTSVEYGDPFDIMGIGYDFEDHFSHWNKSILQWIPDAAIPVATNDGIYRLYRFDHAQANLTNVLGLKIPRDATRDYWIGYRRATSNANLNSGAYILWGYNNNQGAHLLDMTTPGSNIQDPALGIDATFVDLATNIAIKPVALGGVEPNEYLDVQVTFGGVAPFITTAPQTQITTPGQSAVFIFVAGGNPSPSYQWQRQASSGGDWAYLDDVGVYTGSDTAALIVNDTATSMDGDQFRCVISNSSGSVTSSPPAILTVIPFGVTTLAGQIGIYGHADGIGRVAQFSCPSGVAVDSARNIYVADKCNSTIRKITPLGEVSTFAGLAGIRGSADGVGSDARFRGPSGVAVDSGGSVYVADAENHTIRKITQAGAVSTVAGLASSSGSANGTGSIARFYYPNGVAVDTAGIVYVADSGNLTIRKITPAGVVSTLAGAAGNSGSADGTGSDARFQSPDAIAVDTAGNIYVADTGNNTIRKITPAGVVNTLVGLSPYAGSLDGIGSAARFNSPGGITIDALRHSYYVTDQQNHTIRKVTPAGVVSTLAGVAGVWGSSDGIGIAARFFNPFGIAVDNEGSLYVADYVNNTIRKIVIPPVPQLTETALSNGVFRVVLNGSVGSIYFIQTSSNLVNWSTISTNTIPQDGIVLIVDSSIASQPRRFYRAVLLATGPVPILATSGVITAPFFVTSGYIHQTNETTVTTGGRAAYNFTVPLAGDYVIQTMVNAPDGGANSFFVNIDAEPQNPSMVWDIPLTVGFEQRTVSWRGNGVTNSQFVPKIFNLNQGPHQLIIRGREADALLQSITIRLPAGNG